MNVGACLDFCVGLIGDALQLLRVLAQKQRAEFLGVVPHRVGVPHAPEVVLAVRNGHPLMRLVVPAADTPRGDVLEHLLVEGFDLGNDFLRHPVLGRNTGRQCVPRQFEVFCLVRCQDVVQTVRPDVHLLFGRVEEVLLFTLSVTGLLVEVVGDRDHVRVLRRLHHGL